MKLENIINKENVSITFVDTNLLKTIDLTLFFSIPYSRKDYVTLKVLTKYIGLCTKTFNTKKKMVDKCDNLYGFNTIASYSLDNGNLCLSIKFTAVNIKYLNDITIDDYKEFILEIIENTYFNQEYFTNIIETLKLDCKSQFDDPLSYSLNEYFKQLAKSNSYFDRFNDDIILELDEVSINDLNDLYSRFINNSELRIYCTGKLDDTIKKYISSFNYKNHIKLDNDLQLVNKSNKDEVIEEKNIGQSTIITSYKFDEIDLDKNYPALFLGSVILGGTPASLLFQNIREKQSLCYMITSILKEQHGFMPIIALIDKLKYNQTKTSIISEVNSLKEGNFSNEQLEAARAYILNSLIQIEDNLSQYVFYLDKSRKSLYDLKTLIEKITSLSKQDIIDAYKSCNYDFTYFLKGDKQ